MINRYSAAFVVAALFACALSAQASINLSGTAPDTEDQMYLIEVDFGGMSQSVTLSASIGATSGTAGLDVDLIDLDEMAANGSTNGIVSGSDSGTTPVSLNMTTPSYQGIHQYVVVVSTDSAGGSSPYMGTLSCTTLTAGTIVQVAFTTWPYTNGYYTFFGRAARLLATTSGAATVTQDVKVDFGSSTQTMTFFAEGLAFFVDGTVDVYEVLPGGSESLLGTLTMNSGSSYDDEANFTTSARSDVVTIRYKINASVAGDYAFNFIGPSFATVKSPTSGGGGGSSGGCSTTGTTGLNWLALLGVLAGLGVAVRIRGARE